MISGLLNILSQCCIPFAFLYRLVVLLLLPSLALPSSQLLLRKKAVQQIWRIIDCALKPKIALASPEVLIAKKI